MVAPPRDLHVAAVARDGEPEDGEGGEGHDEEQHDEEVEPERPRDTEAGPDEASEGDHEDDKAKDEQRRLEEVLTRCGVPGHPHAGPDDGDGGQEGYQVEEANHCVTEPVHLSLSLSLCDGGRRCCGNRLERRLQRAGPAVPRLLPVASPPAGR